MVDKVYTIMWTTDSILNTVMHEEYTKIGEALDRYAQLANYHPSSGVDHVIFVEGFVLTETYRDTEEE